MYRSSRRAPSLLRRFLVGAVGIALVGSMLTVAAIATDTFGAGHLWLRVVNRVERFIAGPVPDRPTIATVGWIRPFSMRETYETASPARSATSPCVRRRRRRRSRSVDPRLMALPAAGRWLQTVALHLWSCDGLRRVAINGNVIQPTEPHRRSAVGPDRGAQL